MFSYCSELISIDSSDFNIKNVEEMTSVFDNCYNLETIIFSNLKHVIKMDKMFYNCISLKTMDFS